MDRFDRTGTARQYERVHQEDMCQALAVMPHVKYEMQGGPGIADMVRLLRDASSDAETDIRQLLGMVIFNWVIAATDAHARNFALLHALGPELRLAPFYDLISYLPYDTSGALHQVKMAMRIGGEYRVRHITRARWRKLAEQAHLDATPVNALAARIVRRVQELTKAGMQAD
ncbi:MAG TPA: HipA domain-containing protein [Gemmatimonadaceae bacterium]|nr:HipA domain-containing protein [Gemmatimonadaceae bacterium]